MDNIFRHQIKVGIERLKEGNFQAFLNELFLKKYGAAFTPIKGKRDKSCDGILNNDTVIAAYAPEIYALKKFKKKVRDDHDGYVKHWRSNYPKWLMVYNGEFTAEALQYLDSLGDGGNERFDINQLLNIFQDLNWSSVRGIAEYLGIGEEYYINDILGNVIDDLLKGSSIVGSFKSEPFPYIGDKIKLNYTADDVDNAMAEYGDILPFLGRLKDTLKSYDNAEIAALKSRVCVEYGKLSGDFKTRLNNLTELLAQKNKNDQQYLFYVRSILIYMFEICLIGKRVGGENDSPSA